MMEVRKTYIFFLILTTVGAFLTIKICSAAYDSYDYLDTTYSTSGVDISS